MGASIWTRIALKAGRLVDLSMEPPTPQSIHQDAHQTEVYVPEASSTEIASWSFHAFELSLTARNPQEGRKEGKKNILLLLRTPSYYNSALWCFALRNPWPTASRYQETVMALILLFSSAGWRASGAFWIQPLATGSWNFQYVTAWPLQQGAELCKSLC